MARSNMMQFWKLLSDAEFTGRLSKQSEPDILKMAKELGWTEADTDAAPRGFRDFLKLKG
jgi:hypothetical protein